MPDKTIKCLECGEEFLFSEKDQAHFAAKKLADAPKRCKACRLERRVARGQATWPRFDHVCAQCGTDVKLLFPPVPGWTTFCHVHYRNE